MSKRDYKHEYETYQKHRIPYRVKLKKLDKELGGTVGDGKDVSHKKGGGFTLENASKNRARNRGKK